RSPVLSRISHRASGGSEVPMANTPHGGKMVSRLAGDEEARAWRERQADLPSISLNERQVSDLEMIATGGLSPLTGFMGRADYDAVVGEMHLAGGLPWTIPVTLAVSGEQASTLREGQEVALRSEDGRTLLGILHLREKFTYDRAREAREVYR